MDSDVEEFNSAMSSDGFEGDGGSSFGGGELLSLCLFLSSVREVGLLVVLTDWCCS